MMSDVCVQKSVGVWILSHPSCLSRQHLWVPRILFFLCHCSVFLWVFSTYMYGSPFPPQNWHTKSYLWDEVIIVTCIELWWKWASIYVMARNVHFSCLNVFCHMQFCNGNDCRLWACHVGLNNSNSALSLAGRERRSYCHMHLLPGDLHLCHLQ